ncbi:hypothetical protein HMPREF0105_0255 [Bacteroides sp. 3_1_33FAA]|uniref:Uncharacterized protein n=1 Tax=Phocaeicola dorei DSM 17855 TaxID=483217 RepID=B6W428_9BACT|nr:hypothetical protein BACDOR_04325 [Phocaeicola dorei DSM 17855]EEZ22872.1 hypothetical protein HMPREF0105_0255 [Bacteroides sp. 3_1_33FAA]
MTQDTTCLIDSYVLQEILASRWNTSIYTPIKGHVRDRSF